MKQITSQRDRKRFYELHQAGRTYNQIAEEYGVSPECVRLWCRRQRNGSDVHNCYYNPRSGSLSQFSAQVKEEILKMRREHPHWGPASLLLHLRKDKDLADQDLPSRASIGRYLHDFVEFRHIPKKSPK